MLIVDIGHIRYDEGIYPESDVRLGFGYLIALCSPAISVPKFQVLLTDTRVHSVIFVISLKLCIFPLRADYRPGNIHPLLKVKCSSSIGIGRIPPKLKMLTGTYFPAYCLYSNLFYAESPNFDVFHIF
jgi:hypothetical protein